MKRYTPQQIVQKLRLADVEKKFNIGDQQAKRVLSGLTARSLIEFKRKPHPGFYVLCKK